ncbi:MAG TPA: efflux RND transporter periplasmic adaptor subunit [Clostridia bacterium]|nr:efflux RND transporter periplasmic adaptor subunit [Clostridia bacterium]
MKKLLIVSLAIVLLSMSGCQSLLPKEVNRKVPPLIKPTRVEFDTYTVSYGTIDYTISGTVIVDTTDKQVVEFYDYGSIVKVYVSEGDYVEKGTLLAEQYSAWSYDMTGHPKYPEFRMKSDMLMQLKYDYRIAQANDAPQEELDKMLEQMEELDKWLKANNFSENNKVYASMSGVVQDLITPNEYPGEERWGQSVKLMTIVDYDTFTITYQGAYAREFVKGMEVQIKKRHNADPNFVVKATVSKVETEKERGTYFTVSDEDRDKLKVGEIYDVYGTVAKAENVLVIPKALPKNYNGKDYVEVITPDEKKVEKIIELGLSDRTYVEVKSGLDEGDMIIIR